MKRAMCNAVMLVMSSGVAVGCQSSSAAEKKGDVQVNDVHITDAAQATADMSNSRGLTGEPALFDAPTIQDATSPVMALSVVDSLVRYSFGQGDKGFVLWASASGKLAVLMRFEDDNGDGRVVPQFGQHGEALVDAPVPYLVDVYTGQMTRVAEILTWDSASRYIAVRPEAASASIHVWDAELMTRVTIDEGWGVELGGDGNVCLKPRQVHLSPDGKFWGIEKGEQGVLGRALNGRGQDVRIALDAGVRVWRIEPAAQNWLSVMYVPEDSDRSGSLDLPVQNTSCACRFCGRFAMSMGVYGWGGDAWRMKLASPLGVLSEELDGFAQPLTANVFVDAASEELLTWPDGKPLATRTPRGCSRAPWLVGEAPRVVLTCEDERALLWEPTQAPVELELPVTILAASEQRVVTSSMGTHWFGAVVRTADSEIRSARVRMEDGFVELGERLYEQVPAVRVDRADVMEITAQGASEFVEISSGRRWRGEVNPSTRLVFSPRGDAMSIGQDAPGTFIVPEGCVLAPSSQENGIEQGPWQVTCAQPKEEK